MADYIQQIAQVLYWAKINDAFRDFFFQDQEAALNALVEAGSEVSGRARDRLKQVTPETLDENYQRAMRSAAADQLTRELPDLGLEAEPEVELVEVDFNYFMQCLEEDKALRELFFASPEDAYEAASFAGYDLSEDGRRQLRKRPLTRENFAKRMETVPRTSNDTPAMLPAVKTPTQRIVNTGFAAATAPARPMAGDKPLPAATGQFFWFEVGGKIEGSIEAEDVALPDTLPPDVRLQVALFTFPNGILLTDGQDVGEIEVPGSGAVRVTRRVAEPDGVDEELLARRLLFPVRTPAAPGRYQLRCHIYYRQTLLQSRLVTVHVGEMPENEPALQSVVDYTMSKSLDGRQLQGMGENRLSLMLNENGNGTHGFRYFGENDFKRDLTLGEGELKTQIKMARDVLRYTCWGDTGEYTVDKKYKYAHNRDLGQLQTDLTLMAQRGFRFFSDLLVPLAGDADSFDVWDWLLPPGQIQFASKRSARLVLPLAMMYDYPFQDGDDLSDYTLCPDFVAALQQEKPLLETDCFQGNCPSYGEDRVVCPSGFWGFRHSIGLPVTNDSAPDVPTRLPVTDKPHIAASVFTGFELLSGHTQRLRGMGVGWEVAKSRDDTLAMLKKTESQAVYFYCHGGLASGLPFLQVGTDDDDRLVANNFLNKRIRWRKIRPLVFINGCHTTALHPENALDFVTTLMGTSHAAGVIGTEITIFEALAVTFAEEFFRQFLVNRQTVGDAVRLARINMLQDWNPLGLVYIPYALPGMSLA